MLITFYQTNNGTIKGTAQLLEQHTMAEEVYYTSRIVDVFPAVDGYKGDQIIPSNKGQIVVYQIRDLKESSDPGIYIANDIVMVPRKDQITQQKISNSTKVFVLDAATPVLIFMNKAKKLLEVAFGYLDDPETISIIMQIETENDLNNFVKALYSSKHPMYKMFEHLGYLKKLLARGMNEKQGIVPSLFHYLQKQRLKTTDGKHSSLSSPIFAHK